MHGAFAGGSVIDIVRIDTDERCSGVSKILAAIGGQKRVAFKVLVGAPVGSPAGVDEHGFAT